MTAYSVFLQSHSKPHFYLRLDGVSEAKERMHPLPRAHLCKVIHCLERAAGLPPGSNALPGASPHPFPLSQDTPTWPDCNLSADLLGRQRHKAHIEAERGKEGDLLLGFITSGQLPREQLALDSWLFLMFLSSTPKPQDCPTLFPSEEKHRCGGKKEQDKSYSKEQIIRRLLRDENLASLLGMW